MPVPDPVAFTVFDIDIMWYAIMITTGMILAVAVSCRRAPRHGISEDRLLTMTVICLPAGIIGARLYYVIFNWSLYSGDILSMLNIRAGGLAIHGGLILGLGTAFILCLHYRIKPLEVFDLVVPAIALAQSIGRWGNYFNSEAHGGPTDLPWAVTVGGQTYHPTFLYESIWCLILFFILIAVDNRRKFTGQTTCVYGILYSTERFLVEGLRTDSLMIGPFRQAQVISIVIIICCIILYAVLNGKDRRSARR